MMLAQTADEPTLDPPQQHHEQPREEESLAAEQSGGENDSNSSNSCKTEPEGKDGSQDASSKFGRCPERRGLRHAPQARHMPPSPLLHFNAAVSRAPTLSLLPLDTSAEECEGASFMVGHCTDVSAGTKRQPLVHENNGTNSITTTNSKSSINGSIGSNSKKRTHTSTSPSKKNRKTVDEKLAKCYEDKSHHHHHSHQQQDSHHSAKKRNAHKGVAASHASGSSKAARNSDSSSATAADCSSSNSSKATAVQGFSLAFLPEELIAKIINLILEDYRSITLASTSSTLHQLLHQKFLWEGAEVFIPPWSLRSFAPHLHRWQSTWSAAKKMIVPSSNQLLVALSNSPYKLPYDIAWRFDKYVMGEGIEVHNHGTTIKRIAGEMVVALGDAPLVVNENNYAYLEVRIEAMDDGPGGDGVNDFGIGVTQSDEMFELGSVAAEIPGAWVVDFTTSGVCLSVDNMEEGRGTGASSRGLHVGDVVGIGFALSPPTSRRGSRTETMVTTASTVAAAPAAEGGAATTSSTPAVDAAAAASTPPSSLPSSAEGTPSVPTSIASAAAPNRRETHSEKTVVEVFINGVLRDRLSPRSNSRLTRASKLLPAFDLFGRVSELSRSYGKGPSECR